MPRRAATLKRVRPDTPTIGYSDTGARDRQARRALPTNCAPWRAIRERQLQREPLCREHGKRGEIRAATEVDHVDGNDADSSDGNLQSLCGPCHSRKTARENGGFGNRREPRW